MTAVVYALILALVLSASSPAAWAECAWVWWVKTSVYMTAAGELESHDKWDLLKAFPSHPECSAALAKRWQTFVEAAKEPSEPGVTKRIAGDGELFISEHTADEGRRVSVHTSFACYPDTIDPRGPKGGGR